MTDNVLSKFLARDRKFHCNRFQMATGGKELKAALARETSIVAGRTDMPFLSMLSCVPGSLSVDISRPQRRWVLCASTNSEMEGNSTSCRIIGRTL